ncbi:MAG: substrate-binding domain-containing protein [Gammaproteobacteria bacterium]
MSKSTLCRLLGCAGLLLLVNGCDYFDEVVSKDVKTINITMVAKSNTNPVFLSAKLGAEAAAKDLSDKYKMIDVTVDWRTPSVEDAKSQAQRILEAVDEGTDAIMVSCSNDEILQRAINRAVERGVPVMTFDSDAPNSRRFAFYGANDIELGEDVMNQLAKLMGNKGRIAILAGNAGALNLQKRVAGVKKAAASYPEIEIVGVFNHPETAGQAAAEVLRVNQAYPDLDGWAMVGGWAFFSDTLMDKIDPEKLKIVAVDALPAQLPYVEKGIVPVLLGQPTFRWGKTSVEKIIDKIHLDKEVDEINYLKLIPVSRANLGGWSRQLRAWGYEDVPAEYLTYVAVD